MFNVLQRSTLALLLLCVPLGLSAQCLTCGDGAVVADGSEFNSTCPTDVPRSSSCVSPCSQPTPFETAAGIRQTFDFVGTTTFSATGLPAGWAFGTTSGVATDGYGARFGLVQPNCSGGCASTNGFCIGNLASSVSVGSNGSLGKLGANFDGRANVSVNSSYAVLRGQGDSYLASPTFDFSGVQSFKIQFWLGASETSCGQSNGWGSCTGNLAYLEFSANGGSTWANVMTLNINSSSTDMCTANSTNTQWFQEGKWSRVCLTVFKTSTSTGNFYPAATSGTAASGLMVSSTYFTNNFKFRVRYSQSASCTAGISTTNPGRYLAIDYPVITSGNQLIPCGISFINMCGYGADNNDDGVGSSTATTTATAFGTVKRSVNHAERGVEIFTSQNATFGAQNTTGSSLSTNYDLCNAEGGDQQCIDWRSNTNSYTVVYECITDWEGSVNLQYMKNGTAQSASATRVTTAGKTPTIGWRHSATRFVSCGSLTDLNAACNGYLFVSTSLPTQFARGFYGLATNNLGQSWSYYGSTSCSHYFGAPFLAPISVPDTLTGSPNYLTCNGTQPVFTGTVDYCISPSGFSGSPTLQITGAGGFAEVIAAGAQGTIPVTVAGYYNIKATPPPSPTQCIDCGRSVCINVTATDLTACNILLSNDLVQFTTQLLPQHRIALRWHLLPQHRIHRCIVERSQNGQDFQPIGTLHAQPHQTAFQFVDNQPLAGVNYYRLRLENISTDAKYSRVETQTIQANPFAVNLFPNPAQHSITIEHAAGSDLQITDQFGKVVLQQTISNDRELINTTSLSNGMYWVRVLNNDSQQLLKLVIQQF